MDFGRALRISRVAAGLRQDQLAKLAGIHASHVSLIEKGKRRPSVTTVEKLAHALGIPAHLFALLAAESDDLRTASCKELKRAAESLAQYLIKSGD